MSLLIEDTEVRVPGSWNILIVDRETYTVDAVPVTACASFAHEAFIFSPEDGKLITSPIRVIGWDPKGSCIYPAVEKATMASQNEEAVRLAGVMAKDTKLVRDAMGVITAKLDLTLAKRHRAAFGFFRDRRPELYGRLVQDI